MDNFKNNEDNENKETAKKNFDEYGNEKNHNQKLKSDFLPKILSVIAAVVLWFYVVGIQSPDWEQTFSDIPVMLTELPEDSGLSVISGYETTVSVTLTGKKNEIMKIKSSDIKAFVDLGGVNYAGEIPIGINIKQLAGATVSGINPSIMYAYIDKTISKTVPVEVEYTGGTTDINLVIDETTPSQKAITITGPEETIDDVESAVIFLDIGFVDRSFEVREKVSLVDKKKKTISNPYISMSTNEMKVTVNVNKYKTVPINLKTSGVVDKENIIYKLEPDKVTIKGASEVVDNIDSIDTELVDETRIDGEALYQLKLSLPANVSATLESDTIKANITLKNNSSKVVTLTSNNIFPMNENRKYEVTLKTEYLNLNLRGETKELSKYNTLQIYAQYDVSSVNDEGTIKLPVKITVPNSETVYNSGDYYVEVNSKLK